MQTMIDYNDISKDVNAAMETDLGWKRGEIPKKIKDRIILCSDLRGVAQTKDNCRKKG